MDGWASQSDACEDPPYTPLLAEFHPEIAMVDPDLRPYGFSWSRPGFPYSPVHTYRSRLRNGAAARRFAPYAPRDGVSAIYVAFSLAGPLALLGSADWCGPQTGSTTDVASRIRGIVLIQPFFALKSHVATRIKRQNDPSYAPILEFIRHRSELTDLLVKAIATLRERGIAVRLLYWDGDGILDFDGWPRHFAAPITVPLTFPGVPDDDILSLFDQHCRMPAQNETKAHLRNVLRSLAI